MQFSPVILLVDKKSLCFHLQDQFKFGFKRIPLEYVVDHYRVLEVLRAPDNTLKVGQNITVTPAYWDKHGDVAMMYDCPRKSPHPLNFYYDRKTAPPTSNTLIIFITVEKGIWSYSMINALEDPEKKKEIEKLLQN